MSKFAVSQSAGAKSMSVSNTRVPRIGELLVAANIIKTGVLNESLQIAKTSKTLIGRTLISLGQLDEQKLQAALEIQKLIRTRVVTTQIGIKALTIACMAKISAEEALQRLGLTKDEVIENNSDSNTFNQFLLESGLISSDLLAVVEQQSIDNNLPLGRCLIVNRYTTQAKLDAVLTALALIKEQQINREQALKALKLSFENSEPLEHNLVQLGIQQIGRSEKRVLDILISAGYLSESTKLAALEIALAEDRTSFEVLNESGTVPTLLIENAIRLQEQILTGHLTLKHAAYLLKKSAIEGFDLNTLIGQIQSIPSPAKQVEQLIDLLMAIGILNDMQVQFAREISAHSDNNLGQVLLEQHSLDLGHLESAWQAQRMIDDKMISSDYARKALRKLTGVDKETQSVSQDEMQNITVQELATMSAENWLSKLAKKIFKK